MLGKSFKKMIEFIADDYEVEFIEDAWDYDGTFEKTHDDFKLELYYEEKKVQFRIVGHEGYWPKVKTIAEKEQDKLEEEKRHKEHMEYVKKLKDEGRYAPPITMGPWMPFETILIDTGEQDG
jgi:DNA-dependent RNA polymerase auxiliary subunit epsilon